MALSLTTLSNGAVMDVTPINDNFTAVKTLLETTKLSAQANLSTPYSLLTVTFSIDGDLVGGATANRYYKVPAGVTLIPVSSQLAFDVAAVGAPTVTFQMFVGATPALTAACTKSAADDVDERIAFDTTSFAPATTIIFTLTNTTGAGNTANGITMSTTFKQYLVA